MIPEAAVEAAAKRHQSSLAECGQPTWEELPGNRRATRVEWMRAALEAAAPHMLADILEDAANTAETDELSTAAEVIYDLRRHAKDLRPAK